MISRSERDFYWGGRVVGGLGAHRPNDFHDFSEYFVLEVDSLIHLVSAI